MKVLIATQKPFASGALEAIKSEILKQGHQVEVLEKYTQKSQLLEAVQTAQALIIRSDKVDADVMAAAPLLRIIVRAGAGFDNVDLAAATAHGIVVENTPGQNANAVAELVMGLLVFVKRNFYNGKSGSELMGKRLGLLAFGNVGRNVARIAQGFGMEVSAYDAFCPSEVIASAGVRVCKSQEELFQTNDIVSLHIPATPQTRASIGYDLVGLMPEGGTLINTARAEVIDEPGLLRLLKERQDLDYVTDIQPVDLEGFRSLEGRFFATPKKMGAQTAEANFNAGLAAARQIGAFFKDGCTRFQVNK